jgi:hypothetical protein
METEPKEVLLRVNKQTFGQLLRNAKHHTNRYDKLEPLLSKALEERNRLSHHFYRQHNFRRNSDKGRAIMMADLESIHNTLLDALKALSLLDGIDLDAMAKKQEKFQNEEMIDDSERSVFHVLI